MPREKKLQKTSDIIGLGNPDKLTVQKIKPSTVTCENQPNFARIKIT